MEHASIRARKSFWPRLLAALALLVMLIVGRYTYRDYGLTVDETWERETSLINYQYVVKTLLGKDLDLFPTQLENYRERYYGAALQLPTVFVEHLTGFTMPSRDIYMMRHLWSFVICMTGNLCFYLFLERVFSNRWYALLGLLMLALYPRFWGEQFTNIKDMVFMATCCWALLATALSLRHEGKWRWEVLSALLFALCANTRIIGFLFPSLLFGYRLLRDGVLTPVWKEGGARRFVAQLAKHALALLLMLVFYVLVTPAAWASPLRFIIEAFAKFSNYNDWNGTIYFLGNRYPYYALPWYYLPTWLSLSIPLWYLAFVLAGAAGAVAFVLRSRRRLGSALRRVLLGPGRWFVLCLTVAVLPVAAAILMHSTLYSGWRHMYFIFPELVVVALFGVQWLFRQLRGRRWPRRLLAGGLAALLAGQACWIGWMHPFEKYYLNPVGQSMCDLLEKDYWYESTTAQILHILEVDDSRRINLSHNAFSYLPAFHYLSDEDARRVYVYNSLTYTDWTPIDYIIDESCGPVSSTFPGFTPVYELRCANGMLLSTIYMRDEALAERFSGQWPQQ